MVTSQAMFRGYSMLANDANPVPVLARQRVALCAAAAEGVEGSGT